MSSTPLTSAPVIPTLPRHFWLTGLFRSQTWRAFGYHWVALVLTVFSFTYAVTTVSLGIGLAITIIGLGLFALMLVGGRYFGEAFRMLSNALLGSNIPAPLPRQATGSIEGFTKAGLRDLQAWRFVLFAILHFVNSIFAFTTSVTLFAIGLGGVTYRIWYEFLPMQQAADGSWHRGAVIGTNYFIDTPERITVAAAVSAIILFFIWPLVTVKLGAVQALTTASLLGPTQHSLQVQELRAQQAATVDRSAAELRTIERDLHDVTQAQLVAIAMKLSDAKDRLASGAAPSDVASLIDQAHSTSKVALTDLRSLVQGIHPAVLNSGLETALATLTSNAAIPTKLDTNLTTPISPSVETVAYYCAAELLNNVAKHSGSPTALLRAHTIATKNASSTAGADKLVLQVTDFGIGGAALGTLTTPEIERAGTEHSGTGLVGLAQRISAVEGTLDIDSPIGGPTVVTVILPTNLDLG